MDSVNGWLLLFVLPILASARGAPGSDLTEYYGGFFPTEEWIRSLKPIPRGERTNPFREVRIADESPDGKEAWDSPLRRLTQDDLNRLKGEAGPYLNLGPRDLLGLVPRRNRISGNSRVMCATRMRACPTGDAGSLLWTPDRPEEIRCSRGHVVDPFGLFPPTGVIRIRGPKGDEQEYPYHDAADGTRTYVHGEFMDALRVHHLSQAARNLGILYRATKEEEYARRCAAILYDFACAVPYWPKIHRGHPGLKEQDRFRPVEEITVYAGIWYDKYHTGIGHIPRDLALAYDFVVTAPVWDGLGDVDACDIIERDLFLFSVKDALRYDVRYPKPESALSNYIPYQVKGLIAIGRSVGVPELLHYAYWKEKLLGRRTLMADGVFPESPSYGRQHVYGMAQACRLAEGYTDPPGFASAIENRRFENLDMARDIPELRRAIETLESMVYPDDSYIVVHDTYGKLVSAGHPAPEITRPMIYPAFGHAVLGRGQKGKGNQLQAHLHYSGNWGHDHHDMLGLILWAHRDELISDIGYAHTYRLFANNASGHNLVVVDRNTQKRVEDHGRLLGWHPVQNDAQVVEVEAPSVYPQCSVYRRALFLIPLGEMNHVVLDIFEVAGGDIHEWMAQGSCTVDQALSVSVPTAFSADSYADDGRPFTPPEHNEWVKELHRQGLTPYTLEKDPWYGVFRNVHKGSADGPFVATFSARNDAMPGVRLHVLEPTKAEVFTCTVPSLRPCWTEARRGEDHSLVEKFRTPKLIVRRDGEDLHTRFVVLWEPFQGKPAVRDVVNLAPGNPNLVALEIRAGTSAKVLYQADPSQRAAVSNALAFQGRYAAVVSDERGRRINLYDCSYFKEGDPEINIEQRPPLPLGEVVEMGDGNFALRLDGMWHDVGEASFAIVDIHGGQRVVPIKGLGTQNDRTLLHCTREPGFRYDHKTGILKDIVFPFLTFEGKATVSLPSRVRIQNDNDRPGTWRVHSTDSITVAGKRIQEVGRWVSLTPE